MAWSRFPAWAWPGSPPAAGGYANDVSVGHEVSVALAAVPRFSTRAWPVVVLLAAGRPRGSVAALGMAMVKGNSQEARSGNKKNAESRCLNEKQA